MIEIPRVRIEKVIGVARAASYSELVEEALARLGPVENVGGVIAATFSNPERFPSLAVRVAAALHLPPETPAFDLQMACSAYPYAVYLAGRLAADTGKRVLVVDGDVQTPLVDAGDPATGKIFSDAMTVSVISSDRDSTEKSFFSFLSRADEALQCSSTGPIRMDGMKVFTFVATEVREFLLKFIAEAGKPDCFVPHQANPYMVRQLAKSLSLTENLLTLEESVLNPGSASVPLTLASCQSRLSGSKVLIAGFGAGYSASAGLVEIL